MAFLDFLFGKKEKTKEFQKYSPQQQGVLGDLLGGASAQLPDIFAYLGNILGQDEESMKAFSAPAMRAFEEQTLPTIAERFTGANAQKSSAFGQQLGQAGASLQENLAAQRAGLSSGAINQLMQLLQSGLTPQTETAFRPGTSGLVGGLAGGGSSGLGQLIQLLGMR